MAVGVRTRIQSETEGQVMEQGFLETVTVTGVVDFLFTLAAWGWLGLVAIFFYWAVHDLHKDEHSPFSNKAASWMVLIITFMAIWKVSQ